MRLCVFTRLLAAAGTVLLGAASVPGFAQTADVSVALTTAKTKGNQRQASTTLLQLGVEKTYNLTVTNNGPSHVTSFVVDATFTPPAAPYNGAIAIGSVAGCVPRGVCTGGTNASQACYALSECPDHTTAGTSCHVTTSVPCKVTLAAPLISGAGTTVGIPVTVPLPAALPTTVANCPTAATTVAATATVSDVLQNATAVDGNAANNTATINTAIAPFADLDTTIAGPANTGEGQAVQYTTTITNHGPCDVTGLFSDLTQPSTLTLTSTSCTNDLLGDAGCDLSTPDLAAGATRTWTSDWTVNNYPKSIFKAAIPMSVDAIWDQDVINGPDPADPTHSNAASMSTTVDLSSNEGGCSTGGAGTLLALLPLLALRFGRRRSA